MTTVTTTSCETKNNLNRRSNSRSPIRRNSSRSSNKSYNKASHVNGKLPTIQLSPADNRCYCYHNGSGLSYNEAVTFTSPSPRLESTQSRAGTSLREVSLGSMSSSPFLPSLSSMSPTPQFLANNYNAMKGAPRYENEMMYNLPIVPKRNKYFINEANNNMKSISFNNNDKTTNDVNQQPVCCYCSQCNPVSPKFPFCAACAASAGKLKRTAYKSASIAVPTLAPIIIPENRSERPTIASPSSIPSKVPRSPSLMPVSPLLRINPKDHHLIFQPSSNHGCFRKSVPSMPMIIAIFCCLLNFFLPGSGTLLASMSVLFGCNTEYGKLHKTRAFSLGILIGIIQMSTAIFVLGWVWSIMWGINFIKHSSMESEESLYPDHPSSLEVTSTTSIYDNNNVGFIKEANSV